MSHDNDKVKDFKPLSYIPSQILGYLKYIRGLKDKDITDTFDGSFPIKDKHIIKKYGVSSRTVYRIRKDFLERGLISYRPNCGLGKGGFYRILDDFKPRFRPNKPRMNETKRQLKPLNKVIGNIPEEPVRGRFIAPFPPI